MSSQQPVPRWLWRIVSWSLAGLLAAIAGLAVALGLGAADPPRAGPLLWQDDFKAASTRWTLQTLNCQPLTAGAAPPCDLAPRAGALVADFAAGRVDASVVALTQRPPGDFTLEMAGAQTGGEIGTRYGLVFGWRDTTHYSAVLVNGNGYAEAYQVEGSSRHDWFTWQQWPNLLVGTDSNRVRLDVRGGQIRLRINDEFLLDTAASAEGDVGVWATDAAAPSQVVFSWVRVWAKPD